MEVCCREAECESAVLEESLSAMGVRRREEDAEVALTQRAARLVAEGGEEAVAELEEEGEEARERVAMLREEW